MEAKKGLFGLGFVKNYTKKDGKSSCIEVLSKMVGRRICPSEIDRFIDSEEFSPQYFDANGNSCTELLATKLRFLLPMRDRAGRKIYGEFSRNSVENSFVGVTWFPKRTIMDIGVRQPDCMDKLCRLAELADGSIDISTLDDDIVGEVKYYNGAGHTIFPDKRVVSSENAKFARFETTYKTNAGKIIYGWYTKRSGKGGFEGIDWGTLEDFETSRKNREQFFVGRMAFESFDECNAFLHKLVEKTIEEPWGYPDRDGGSFKYPILKSYLQFELERLFYEHEELKFENKILYNTDKTSVLFNTNLINKFGHDLNIVGDVFVLSGKEYIRNLRMCPPLLDLKRMGFTNCDPVPPKFFSDINEICFHCEWEIDSSVEKYEHIIEERQERFPEKYRYMAKDELGQKLDNAIKFAKKIAQRNYKFIVPMYYPIKRRIQLLMPIYLDGSYSTRPDFALVLTPYKEGIYVPETILGLDEVYQDARLVAKPEESWLKITSDEEKSKSTL